MNFKLISLSWVILGVTLVWCLFPLWKRHQIEASNRTVEVVLDYDALFDLCSKQGLNFDATLQKFHDAGVTTVALSEMTLDKLHQFGKIFLIRGEDVSLFPEAIQSKFKDSSRPSLPCTVIVVNDSKVKVWLSRVLSELLGPLRYREIPSGFVVTGKLDDVSSMGLGLFPEQAEACRKLGLWIAPRLENRDEVEPKSFDYLLRSVASTSGVSTVIFAGLRNEVFGFDSDIRPMADFLKSKQIQVGFVEAYDKAHAQKGGEELARRVPNLVVKVQALMFPPLTRLDPERAREIFSLGIRERNVRVVYFRPFTTSFAGKNVMECNLDFLTGIREVLKQQGLQLGKALPYPPISPSPITYGVIALGLVAGSYLLVSLFGPIPTAWVLAAFLGNLILSVLLALSPWRSIWGSVLGVWGAVLFPSLGVVLLTSREPQPIFNSTLRLLFITGFSIAAGILVSCLLTDNLTLLGISGFHGVKAILVLPTLVAPWLAWTYQSTHNTERTLKECFQGLVRPLRKPVQVSHLLIFVLLIGLGGMMLLRSGNAPPEGSVSEFEKTFRILLANVLFVRPRFKEFLLGHPFFLLSARTGLSKSISAIFLVLAALGQADIIDSFAHLHTPLGITFLRTLNGVWVGIFIGWFFVLVLERIFSPLLRKCD